MRAKAPYGRVEESNGVTRYFQTSRRIKEAIDNGYHKQGERLPGERTLRELFNVSRTTIRRALKQLSDEGVIEIKPGSGVYIKKVPSARPAALKRLGLTVWQGEDLAYHPATLDVLRGINRVLDGRNHVLRIIPVNGENIENLRYDNMLDSCGIDGLMLTVTGIPDSHVKMIRKLVPEMVVSRSIPGLVSVVMDFSSAARNLTEHLIGLGHSRIAYLSVSDEKDNPLGGFNGYRQALRRARIRFDGELTGWGFYTVDSGYRMSRAVMNLKEPPTAVITGDDFMAMGAKRAFDELGIRCPREVSLASFGDFPFAEHLNPPLTTVRLAFARFGEAIASGLISLLEGKPAGCVTISGMPVVARGSTGPAPENGPGPQNGPIDGDLIRNSGGLRRFDGKRHDVREGKGGEAVFNRSPWQAGEDLSTQPRVCGPCSML